MSTPKITAIANHSNFQSSGTYICEIFHINTPNVKYRTEKSIPEFLNRLKHNHIINDRWVTKATTPVFTASAGSRIVTSTRIGFNRVNRPSGASTPQAGTLTWNNQNITLTPPSGTLVCVIYHQRANYRSFNQTNDPISVTTIDVATMMSKIPVHTTTARLVPEGTLDTVNEKLVHHPITSYNSSNGNITYIDNSTPGSTYIFTIDPI